MTRPNFTIRLSPVATKKTTSGGFAACGTTWVTMAGSYIKEETTGVTRRKPSGWLAPTGYRFLRIEISAPKGETYYQPYSIPKCGYGQWYVGVVGSVPGDPVGPRFAANTHFDGAATEAYAQLDGGMRNAALIAARLKLKSTNINLGIAFAERKRTATLVGDTAIRLARSVNHLRRGEIRRAMDTLGISSKRRQPRGANVPQKWLELQYGWKPLLSDVYGGVDALSKRTSDDWIVTAKATRSYVQERSYSVVPNATLTSGFDACKVSATITRSVFARIDVEPQNGALASLSSLGITNPLLVGWELVPFSFVVDWFMPIGSYLDSLDAMLGWKCKAYSSTLLVRADWTDVGSTHGPLANGYVIRNNYLGTKKMVYVDRTVSTSTPLPSLPRFKDPRSLGHMANGLALLATAFGRR